MKLKLTDHANDGHEVVGTRKQVDAYLAGPLSNDIDQDISKQRIAGARRALTQGDVTEAGRLLEPLGLRVERVTE